MEADVQRNAKAEQKTSYQLWQETIDESRSDPRWHEYDLTIQKVVHEFNRHLARQAGFRPLDWHLIKAMVWTESGGPKNRAWKSNPMQIGNPGDPGLRALINGNEGGQLILPEEIRSRLTIAAAANSPEMNIRAGVGYLLMRLARFDFASMHDTRDAQIYDATVKRGDSLDRIARANGTTVAALRAMNAQSTVIRPGQVLKFRKASIQRIITGWDSFTTARIATLYNVGDPAYSKKLDYCLSLIRRAEEEKR